MEKDYKIIIPARGGSKRIPNKNLINLKGKPLIYYVIKESLKLTSEVYVSTDSQDIIKTSLGYNAKTILRPSSISNDFSKTEEAISHFLQYHTPYLIVIVQPTSPLINYTHIQEGIDLIRKNKFDSIISVCEDRGFYWDEKGNPINFILGKRPRTQDMVPKYRENGAFYITTTSLFKKTNLLYSGNIGYVKMETNKSIDIDDLSDLKLVEKIL